MQYIIHIIKIKIRLNGDIKGPQNAKIFGGMWFRDNVHWMIFGFADHLSAFTFFFYTDILRFEWILIFGKNLRADQMVNGILGNCIPTENKFKAVAFHPRMRRSNFGLIKSGLGFVINIKYT